MREPKFRGFSKEEQKWVYGVGWFKTDYTDEYLQGLGQKEQDAVLMTNSGPVLCYLDSMGQFAGLHDKNGKEIYEGDIVKIDDCDGYDLVTFKSGSLYAESVNQDYADELLSELTVKIVGNKFENPELLEGDAR